MGFTGYTRDSNTRARKISNAAVKPLCDLYYDDQVCLGLTLAGT